MGRLALVVGSKSLSSKRIHAVSPVEDYDCADPTNETLLQPVLPSRNQTAAVTTAVSHDQSLQALVSAHVYDRIKVKVGEQQQHDDDDASSSAVTEPASSHQRRRRRHPAIHSSVADIRIQIVPTTEALSLALYREAHYRVELPPPPPPSSEHQDDTLTGDDSSGCCCRRPISMVFSTDKRFLLLSLRDGGDLILFQLRKPRAESRLQSGALFYQEMTRPTYLPDKNKQSNNSNNETIMPSIPVATQPKHVASHNMVVTAIHRGPHETSFWIGTAAGTLHILNGRPLSLSENIISNPQRINLPQIVQIDYFSHQQRDGGEQRLCILDIHQQVHVVPIHISIPPKDNNNNNDHNSNQATTKGKKKPMVVVRLKEAHWTTLPTTMAVHAVAWLAHNNYVVTVTQAASTITLTVWTSPPQGAVYEKGKVVWIPCRTHVLRKDAVEGLESCRHFDNTNDGSFPPPPPPPPTIKYDDKSETLAVRACFVSDTTDNGPSPKYYALVLLWSWQPHVQGWAHALPTALSAIHWGLHPIHQHAQLIVTMWANKLRKERYDMAYLSASSSRRTTPLSLANPLVLASNSAWYPQCTQPAGGQEQMEWMEVRYPAEYVSSHGTPTLGAWSESGSFVAVAARRGLLVMTRRQQQRWQQFANSSAEQRVQVLAMAWWDGLKCVSDDAILVALVRVQREDDETATATYLSCWSSRFLDADKQLLIPVPSYNGGDAWGMALPSDMDDDLCLDVLCQGDKAVVLAWRSSTLTPYRVYQLQVVPAPQTEENNASYQEHRPYFVLSTCIATGVVDSCSRIWLASTSFGFDLVALRNEGKLDLRLLDYVATLGVWRQEAHGLLDALAISPDTVVAVGEVCCEADAVVVGLWIADRTDATISWTLMLSNGKLITWKLATASQPLDHVFLAGSMDTEENQNIGPRWVNEHSRLVGKVCATESTAAWMQGAGRMTSSELCLGRMPGGRFGYTISAGQSCRQMHRMLGEDFESEIFLSDFLQNEVFGPGDLVLVPPLFVSPLYMSILENPFEVQEYLNLPVKREKDKNAILLALRLLVFVSVDRMAKNKSTSKSAREARTVFQSAIAVARSLLGKESLQFVSFIIELARQLEPSRFEYFLPLPPPGNESIGRLLEIASTNGSVSLSLVALPLVANKATACAICTNTFRLCLSACMKPQSIHHQVRREASDVLSDLFRFGLKLEGTEGDMTGGELTDRSKDISAVIDDDSSDDGGQERPQYSMLCGLSRIFGGGSKAEYPKISAAADSFIDHGVKASTAGSVNVRALGLSSAAVVFENVTGVVAHMFHTLLLDVSHLMLWGSAARMASLLLPESLAGLRLATKQDCTVILRNTAIRPIRHILPKEFRRKDGLVDFFSASISRCMDCLDEYETSRVVDLLRVILRNKVAVTERQAEHQATLLLVLLVVGHVSGRLGDLVEENIDHLILDSFHKAIKGPEPKPPSPTKSTSSDDDEASQKV